MKVYLAGPMTGYPEYNFPAFNAAAKALRELDHEVINPAEFGADLLMWSEYLRRDIPLLAECEALVLLPGWEKSRGATFEAMVAGQLGIQVAELENYAPISDRTIHAAFYNVHLKNLRLVAVA